MRKITWMVAIVMCVTVLVTGCGSKSTEDVVKDVGEKLDKLESYKSSGSMTFYTGQEPQEYDVEVWFKKDHLYRISLKNKKKDVTQIVLRNADGVFVLTPHLKKSFRFQSEWPDNQGQVYLFQSLAEAIVKDETRQVTLDEESDAYVFDVAGNYKNPSFARQKIWLTQNDYKPTRVQISDENGKMLVEVNFDTFEFGTQFAEQDFDMQHNLTMHSVTTVATLDEEGVMEDQAGEDAIDENKSLSFGVIEPSYIPEEVGLISQPSTVQLADEEGIMLRYGGAYNFVLVESHPQEQTASFLNGDVIDLGFGMGVLTGEDQKTLHWTLDGVEYKLISGDLPTEEMKKIAISVDGQVGK